jgi:endoglucanase
MHRREHIESWSTNEITINRNAPFAWLTAWLDEHAK